MCYCHVRGCRGTPVSRATYYRHAGEEREWRRKQAVLCTYKKKLCTKLVYQTVPMVYHIGQFGTVSHHFGLVSQIVYHWYVLVYQKDVNAQKISVLLRFLRCSLIFSIFRFLVRFSIPLVLFGIPLVYHWFILYTIGSTWNIIGLFGTPLVYHL